MIKVNKMDKNQTATLQELRQKFAKLEEQILNLEYKVDTKGAIIFKLLIRISSKFFFTGKEEKS